MSQQIDLGLLVECLGYIDLSGTAILVSDVGLEFHQPTGGGEHHAVPQRN